VIVLMLAWIIQSRRSRVIFDSPSEFGRVRVVERRDGLRYLVTGEGRARQSAIYPGRPLHLELEYTRVGAIGLALIPPDGRILFVGLGGGAMPMYARSVLPDARIDVVEIDPVIVRVAQQYFGFESDARMLVHTGDGRAFIENAPAARYDLIVLDAFSDDEVPFALTTRQFLGAVRRSLAPDGVVASNLWTANPVYPSMLATYDAVFDELHLLRVPARSQRILVAHAATRSLDRDAIAAAAQDLAARADLGFDLARLVRDGYEPLPVVEAPILEDSAAGGRSGSAAPPLPVTRPRSLAALR
jgi:spermidine synthase